MREGQRLVLIRDEPKGLGEAHEHDEHAHKQVGDVLADLQYHGHERPRALECAQEVEDAEPCEDGGDAEQHARECVVVPEVDAQHAGRQSAEDDYEVNVVPDIQQVLARIGHQLAHLSLDEVHVEQQLQHEQRH